MQSKFWIHVSGVIRGKTVTFVLRGEVVQNAAAVWPVWQHVHMFAFLTSNHREQTIISSVCSNCYHGSFSLTSGTQFIPSVLSTLFWLQTCNRRDEQGWRRGGGIKIYNKHTYKLCASQYFWAQNSPVVSFSVEVRLCFQASNLQVSSQEKVGERTWVKFMKYSQWDTMLRLKGELEYLNYYGLISLLHFLNECSAGQQLWVPVQENRMTGATLPVTDVFPRYTSAYSSCKKRKKWKTHIL